MRARAAGDPAVTIADFQFAPGTTTVHVGDTVTWSNNGPSPHTATARDNSFNTGILQKGARASHTFTRAGTFTYYCQIHPFMHGTIVVLAATATTSPAHTSTSPRHTSTSPTPTSSATAKSTGGSTAASGVSAASGGQSLPMTGFNVITELAYAVALLALGLSLRRVLRR